jgi:hypothetical protein
MTIMPPRRHGPRRPLRYQIRVRGALGRTIRAAFPALQAQAQEEDTVLTGTLADQAALYGVLAQIEALGLELIEVRRESPSSVTPPHPEDRQAEPS